MTFFVCRFEEGSVVCLPVKFFPGSFEIVQDLDVTESAKASKNLAASPSEDSEEADESDGRIEWLEFVSKVSEELREEKELAVGMPVVEKVEKEKTELDQTEVDGEALDETVADDTVVIGKPDFRFVSFSCFAFKMFNLFRKTIKKLRRSD